MKQRNIMAVIFLSIITLGIYDLFWLVSVKKELNAKTTIHTPTLWLLFAPLLLLIGGAIAAGIASAGTSSTATGANITIILIYMIAILVILPITFYWFFKFSKAVGQYTHGEMNTAITFILLWLLRFIGMAIIQDKFNDMLAGGPAPGPAPVAPAWQQPNIPAPGPVSDDLNAPQGVFTPSTPVAPAPPTVPASSQPPVPPVNPPTPVG